MWLPRNGAFLLLLRTGSWWPRRYRGARMRFGFRWYYCFSQWCIQAQPAVQRPKPNRSSLNARRASDLVSHLIWCDNPGLVVLGVASTNVALPIPTRNRLRRTDQLRVSAIIAQSTSTTSLPFLPPMGAREEKCKGSGSHNNDVIVLYI